MHYNKYKFIEQPTKIYSSSPSAFEEFIQKLQYTLINFPNRYAKNRTKDFCLSSGHVSKSFARMEGVSDSVSAEWISVYNPKLIPTEDGVRALKVDDDGNSFLAGVTDSAVLGESFFTCKLDSVNNVVWSSLYHSPVKAVEGATDLYIDSEKNVYVVGYSYRREYQSDIIILKFDNNGNQLWVRSYGVDNGAFDYPNVITGDQVGNIYIGGARIVIGLQSNGAGALLLKYDGDGNLRQEILFPGHQHWGAVASFIHVDYQGNMYVAGTTSDTLAASDFLVMKYDSNGTQLWTRSYNGPGSNYDIIRSMKVDQQGYIIVTGESWGSSSPDCATIKYNPDGTRLWLRRNSSPSSLRTSPYDMTIDSDGNIYITGGYAVNLDLGEDSFVFKYNSAGNLLWQSTYPDTGFRQNNGRSIRLDDSNRVHIVMTHAEYYPVIFSYLLQYSSSGTLQSTIPIDSSYLAMLEIDSKGKAHFAGTKYDKNSSWDIVAVSYDPQMDKSVQNQINVSWISSNYAVSLAKDPFENIFVVARTNTLQDEETSVVKYNAKGQTMWSQRYKGRPLKAATDNNGNVYVLAQLSNYATGENDFLTLKYNSNGVLEWTQQYSSATRYSQDFPRTLNVDLKGNVYVAGLTQDTIEHSTGVIIKYDQSGNQRWISYYEVEAGTRNSPNTLGVDSVGNVFFAGASEIVYGGRGEFLTIKYNSDGVQQWVRKYQGNGFGYNYITGIGIDSYSNVYVTGLVTDSMGSAFATLKYDTSGTLLWETKSDITNRRFSNPPTGLLISKQGEIFVSGSVRDNEFGNQLIVLKYDSIGNNIWVSEFDSSGESNDYATAFTIDETGNAYVTGYRYRSQSENLSDYVTVKFDNAGKRKWYAYYQSANGKYDEPIGIVTDVAGNVYVTGSSYDYTIYTSEAITIKYDQSITDVKSTHNVVPNSYNLFQNYPNPFNPSTIFRYQLPEISQVTLRIYNILGQEVKTVVDEIQDAGYKSIEWNPSTSSGQDLASGVYFYRLDALSVFDPNKSFRQIRKMLFMK
ncbi:MAG: SBBP repeat-containing protein [Bacteroidota bacterium]|nr:SBBP repeat-containing protein [Bacteroidota bacterium]